MDDLPIDCLSEIFNWLDFKTQVHFRQVCRKFHTLYITDLLNIPVKYQIGLTDKILMTDQFKNIKLLDVRSNQNITDKGITGMLLHKLYVEYNRNITDKGIASMTLRKLYS